METQTYNRKPFTVEAAQVTEANLDQVVEWTGGKIEEDEVGAPFIRIKVKHPLNARQTKAFPGDWVLKAGEGFKIYNESAFEKSFELAPALDAPDGQPRVHPNQAELNLL